MKKIILFCLLSSVLCFLSSALRAEDHSIEVTTYISSPDGEFQTMNPINLTVGTPAQNVDLTLDWGSFTNIRSNGPKTVLSPNGRLAVGTIQFPNFKIDTVNRRVGFFLPFGVDPQFPLDIANSVRGSILRAYSDPTDYVNSASICLAWYLPNINDYRNGIRGGVGSWPIPFNPISVTVEGDPVFMQSTVKTGVFRGTVGFGSQAIGGRQDAYYTTHSMVVGPSPSYTDGIARATQWLLMSSREFKTDITPISFSDSESILKDLAGTEIYHYRYKQDPAGIKRIGFMAEEAPKIISHDAKSVDVGDSLGMLMASVKALKEEQNEVGRGLEALKK